MISATPALQENVVSASDAMWTEISVLWLRLRSRFESLSAHFGEELGSEYALLRSQFHKTEPIVRKRSLANPFLVDLIAEALYFLERLEVFFELFDRDAALWGDAKSTAVKATASLRSDFLKISARAKALC